MTQTANQVAPHAGVATGPYSADDLERFRRSFAEDGYLVFRSVVPPEELSALHGKILIAYEQARETGSLFSGGGNISGHLNCYPGEAARFAYERLEERGILGVLRTIFPKAVGNPNVGCNLNLPRSVAQHYHADSAFLDDFVIANIAVVDTVIANGAIDVLPGTQKKFYKFWQFAVERAYRRTTRVPLQQGDVLIRTSTLWHRGMPNQTPKARPMLAFTWEKGGSVHPDPFKVDGGKIAFLPNWYRPNLLGRIRERTFVAAPITYSAYRFARSLVGDKGYASF